VTDKLCKHGRKLCSECVYVTDAAKRMYDIVQSYVAFVEYDERIRSWVAIRLLDGGSDGVLYGSKADAVRHTDEFTHLYFSYRGAPQGFTNVRDAAIYLEFHRLAFNAGGRWADKDDRTGGPDLIMSQTKEDFWDQFNVLRGQ
jgi:hypothetical protein